MSRISDQKVRLKTCAFLVCVILILTCVFAQDEPIVREIVIQGLRTVKKENVLNVMRTKVGERSSPEMRQDDLRAIYALGRFSEDIQFFKEDIADGIRITVVLKENPVVADIQVIGNTAYKSSTILARLPFKKGEILPTGAEVKTRMEVERLYAGGGYKNARVKVRVDEMGEGKCSVTIVVEEGKKILIKDLIIRGNRSFGGFRLRFLVENKGSWAFIKNYYDETTFEDDLEVLRQFYKTHGFLDVVVKRGKPEYNEERAWISPVIEITEGPRYIVRDVIPQNAVLFTNKEITDCFAPLKGNFYNADKFRKGMEKLRRLYGDEGYTQMEAEPDFKRLPKEPAINLVLNIKENERIYVGKIRVRRIGYTREPAESALGKMYDKISPPPTDAVVLREVTLKPGDVYRSFQEVRSIERLKRLEIFDSVSITREPTESKDVRDAVVNVKEGTTGNVIFGVGYGEDPGAYLQASVRERNLFGDARDLRASVLFGTRSSAFHIGYLDRYWRSTDMSLDWELYCDRFFRREYGERIYGTSLEFGKPLSEYVKAYLRFRLEDVNFFDEDDKIRTRLDSYPLAAVRFRIEEDRLNDTWWPTRGFTRSAGVELGYADGPLAKLFADFSYYNNFYKDFVYSISGFAGLIPYNSDNVGITERFFLGGANDLRGFAYRGAGPKDKGDHEMAIGGSTKLLLKNEIRYPIYDELKGLVFLDMGMLDETVGLDKPRASVGTGFRLKISFVRIYVDFAEALIKEHRDNTQIFHFRLGANF